MGVAPRSAAAIALAIATLAPARAHAAPTSPVFASGARMFVAFAGRPATIRVTWQAIAGAVRYHARFVETAAAGSTPTVVDVELPGDATAFERSSATPGHHALTLVALDAQGHESPPADLAIEVVSVVARPPGATQPEAPDGRAFAIGTEFSSPGFACAIDDEALGPVARATHPGIVTLACEHPDTDVEVRVPVVIAPVVVGADLRPLRAGVPTELHLTVASVAKLGEELGVVGDGHLEVRRAIRTPRGIDVTVVAPGEGSYGLTIVVDADTTRLALGHVDVDALAALPEASTVAPRDDWFGLDVGGQVGFFLPQGSLAPSQHSSVPTIGHPTSADGVVDWGPMLGGHVGFYPIRRVGLEGDLALAFTGYATQSGVSTIAVVRPQLAVRAIEDGAYGLRLVAGADILGELAAHGTSHRAVTGGVHAGITFTIEVRPNTFARFTALDVLVPALDAGFAHCIELQVGVMTRLGRHDRGW